ncbi:MAG: histidine kinase [Chitinophagaceae bacterium]|jgi:sensor histidine kinase YesM
MRSKNSFNILFHFIGWILFLALPFLLRPSPVHIPQAPDFPAPEKFNPLYFSLITNVLILPFFYLNLYFLFPRYVPEKKYGKFVAAQILILILISLAKQSLLHTTNSGIEQSRPGGLHRDFFFIFSYIFITLIAFSYGMIRESNHKERIQKEKENETLKTELQFLRWQINPHFLFNALNNIVALARLKSEKLEPVLIKLSTLMRYMLYEAHETKIPIHKEVEYLKSYIDLQSLRIGKEVIVETKLDAVIHQTFAIEPMLLIPFIENAFKHGTGLVTNPFISIEMEVKDSVMLFVVKNRYIKTNTKSSRDTYGIGLLNVKRRLELVYPKKFLLDLDTDDLFTVTLKIDLA